MAVDIDYLDDLMNTIGPVVYPDGVPGEEDESVDELGDDTYSATDDSSASADEVVVESGTSDGADDNASVNNEPKIIDMDDEAFLRELDAIPEKGDRTAKKDSSEEGISVIDYDPLIEEKSNSGLTDSPDTVDTIEAELQEIDAGDVSANESTEIEMDALSEDDIDALINAAKASAEKEITEVKETDDVAELLSMFGDDENISDIKDTLEKSDNNVAVDSSALEDKEVVLPNIEEEEPKEDKKSKKERKKKEKKEKKKKESDEGADDASEKPKKKGLFSKLFNALTEEVEEESEAKEGEETLITDENAKILNELDAEEEPKKKKKKKKKEKGKKDQPKAQDDEADIREKSEDEESADDGKKKKKPKKEKKPKKVKEVVPEKPGKKLPKKRVRNTFILCISILAAIVVLSFFFADNMSKKNARYAFDNAEYDVSYEEMYGMDLNEADSEIYNKSQTIMLMQRKVDSYENYMQLGMKINALNALLEGYDMYPQIMANAEKYGVVDQVRSAYNKILDGLTRFGLTTDDAEEINGYTSAVQYNKRLISIVDGTPFEYEGSSVMTEDYQSTEEASDTNNSMSDILPEEEDFLPENPEDIFNE